VTSLLASQVEAAFAGVPPPGPGSRTLHEAELADYGGPEMVRSEEWYLRSRAPLGRWQDLTLAHLNDCPWAFAHLDAAGLRYFTPAVLVHHLRWLDSGGRLGAGDESLYVALCDSLSMLSSCTTYRLREHHRQRFSLFTSIERRAIHDFMVASFPWAPWYAAPWQRAVAHDASGAPGDWFDAYWPERERPATSHVIALLQATFALDEPLGGWSSVPIEADRAADLSSLPPDAFRSWLVAYSQFALHHPGDSLSRVLLDEIERAIHPEWGSKRHLPARERLVCLTPTQRVALSSFVDACIDDEGLRTMWRRACAHEGAGWFEVLKVP